MKNLLSIIAITAMLFTGQTVFAQNDYRPGTFYEGEVELTKGKVIKGHILYSSKKDRNNQIIFYTDKTNRKTKEKYKVGDLKRYRVGSEEYHSIEYKVLIKQKSFAKVVNTGQIMTYTVINEERDENNPTNVQYNEMMILKKGDDMAIGTARFVRFAKEMSAYISDYKELSEKVKNKEKGYRLIHMEAIIQEYNDWYAKNNG